MNAVTPKAAAVVPFTVALSSFATAAMNMGVLLGWWHLTNQAIAAVNLTLLSGITLAASVRGEVSRRQRVVDLAAIETEAA